MKGKQTLVNISCNVKEIWLISEETKLVSMSCNQLQTPSLHLYQLVHHARAKALGPGVLRCFWPWATFPRVYSLLLLQKPARLNLGFGERSSFLRANPTLRPPKVCKSINTELSPTKDGGGGEVRRCDILNMLDSRKRHSTMQIATIVLCLVCLCHQCGEKIFISTALELYCRKLYSKSQIHC